MSTDAQQAAEQAAQEQATAGRKKSKDWFELNKISEKSLDVAPDAYWQAVKDGVQVDGESYSVAMADEKYFKDEVSHKRFRVQWFTNKLSVLEATIADKKRRLQSKIQEDEAFISAVEKHGPEKARKFASAMALKAQLDSLLSDLEEDDVDISEILTDDDE